MQSSAVSAEVVCSVGSSMVVRSRDGRMVSEVYISRDKNVDGG